MNITELKARQMAALGWDDFAKEMKLKLRLGFASVWDEVRAITDLDLYGHRSEIGVASTENNISIGHCDEEVERFVVTGIEVEARVCVLRTVISATNREGRPWHVVVLGHESVEGTHTRNVFTWQLH